MAGAEEQSPSLTTEQLVDLIKAVGRQPIERDTLYNIVQDFSDYDFSQERSNSPKTGFVELPVIGN
jgi:aminodeoxyfutalosine synthase